MFQAIHNNDVKIPAMQAFGEVIAQHWPSWRLRVTQCSKVSATQTPSLEQV